MMVGPRMAVSPNDGEFPVPSSVPREVPRSPYDGAASGPKPLRAKVRAWLSSHGLVLAALFVLYTIWSSTYLAMWIALETMPPFLMGGVRFLVAGSILYAFL